MTKASGGDGIPAELFKILTDDAFKVLHSRSESRSVVSNSLQPHGLYSPWNSLGQIAGVGSLSLLQGIFPTQGLNPGLPHCRRILYQLSHQGSPYCCTQYVSKFEKLSRGHRTGNGQFSLD